MDAFVAGDELWLEADDVKKQMDIYAEMISAEENKSNDSVKNVGCVIIHSTTTESSIFPVKNGSSDDSTAVSTNPSISSSINVADDTVDTKPLFGLEVVKSFEGAVVATEACSQAAEPEVEVYLEKEDEPSVAISVVEVQKIEKELNMHVSIMDSELDAVETELSNVLKGELGLAPFASTPKGTIKKKEGGDVVAKNTGTVSIEKDDLEQPLTVTVVAETTASTAVAKPHADVSYIPWMGVQLTEYKSMPKVYEDDVLIRVEATTISTRDCLERIRRDNDESLSSETWVPGHEAVGRVVRAGSESKRFLGRRVAVLLPAGGGCSRYVRCHAADLIAVPERASSQDIVFLLSTYLTAYQCLEGYFEIDQSCCVPFKMDEYLLREEDEEGESVSSGKRRSPLFGKRMLISGAGSPVGLALIDVAKHAGAEVYALSHNHHEDEVKEMGVKEGDWYPWLQKEEWRTGLAGKMDIVVDTIGDYGNYSYFYDVMASGGKFMRLNTTSAGKKLVQGALMQGDKEYFPLFKDYKGNHINEVAVDYNIFDSFEEDKQLFTEDLTYLFSLLRHGKIKRRVFSHIDFEMVDQEWGEQLKGYTDILVVSCNEEGDRMKFIC